MRWIFAIALLGVCSGSSGVLPSDGFLSRKIPAVNSRAAAQDPAVLERQDMSARRPIGPTPMLLPSPLTVRQILHNSAMIFSGAVLKVELESPGSGAAPAITQITFRVRDAIRGVHSGDIIVVREWAGLWNTGEHYRAGETVFLFLYPPSKLGLTSPVGGPAGKFLVRNRHVEVGPRHAFLSRGFFPARMTMKDFAVAIRRAERE